MGASENLYHFMGEINCVECKYVCTCTHLFGEVSYIYIYVYALYIYIYVYINVCKKKYDICIYIYVRNRVDGHIQ